MEIDHTYLLKCSAKKDQSAFKQLYDDTYYVLYSVARNLLHDHHLAEETLQESYLKIWLKAATFDASKKIRALTWMSVITKNTALDKLRSKKTRPQAFVVDHEIEDISSPELMPEALLSYYKEIKDHLHSLKDMKSQQKECLFFFNYHGYTHDALSKQLNVPLGTVKSWIRRKPFLNNQVRLS